MTLIAIEDPDDPRIASYRDVRERDLAGRKGLFMAEGEVVVRVLASTRSRFAPRSLLVSEARADAMAAWLRELDPGLPVYVAGQLAMDQVVGFPIHRGVLALGTRSGPGSAAAVLPPSWEPALVVGLVGLANHDNVGGVFRNAAAFGADALLLDGASCDPLYRKAIRVSAGAALTVPFVRGGAPETLVDALVAAGMDVVALSPAGREPLDAVRWARRSAILVGSEGSGLPGRLLARLRSIRIEMAPGVDSLNVAAATAIALHAARKSPRGD